jgi:hypothetical protein
MKIPAVGGDLFHVDLRTDGRTDGWMEIRTDRDGNRQTDRHDKSNRPFLNF